MALIHLKLVTPQGVVADTNASIVNIKTVNGMMGIMPNHVAVMAKLDNHVLNAVCGDTRKYWSVENGLMRYQNNDCLILADKIEPANESD